MNSSLTRRFCESRYRWLIVATVTMLVALATVMPAVDEYFNNRNSRSDLTEELARARATADSLPEFEERVAALQDRLGKLELRAVDEGGLGRFRNQLVDVVRDSGCQIRELEIGQPTQRAWSQDDDPLGEAAQPGAGGPTPFTLERRSVMLAVDGGMAEIYNLLARLKEQKTLSHARRVQLQSASAAGTTVTLELELWLYTLARTPA